MKLHIEQQQEHLFRLVVIHHAVTSSDLGQVKLCQNLFSGTWQKIHRISVISLRSISSCFGTRRGCRSPRQNWTVHDVIKFIVFTIVI